MSVILRSRRATKQQADFEVEARLPDGKTEWRAFDNKKVFGQARNHVEHLDGKQASRYVVDLKGSGVSVDDYKAAVKNAVRLNTIPAPREIMFVTDNDVLVKWVPDVWRPLPTP